MSDKKRIEELERRVRELEARPPVTIIVQPAPYVPSPTYPAPYAPPWQPWAPPPFGEPWVVYDGNSIAVY